MRSWLVPSLIAASLPLLGVRTARAQATAPLVVLDPGHGGSNLGTHSSDGQIAEKEVTLAVARKVEVRLLEAGVRVGLTRPDDETVPLRARVDMANQGQAALLVSIHTNACPAHDQRGFEIYLASPDAADVLSRAAAAQFEGGSPVTTALASDAPDAGDADEIDAVLADAERGAAQERSATLARSLELALRARDPDEDGDADRGVKQASFDVLVGPRMPAVLIEVGFLDHPVEGARLGSDAGQEALADAIAAGVVDTLRAWGKLPPEVAAQKPSQKATTSSHS
jgi:N-acetylmuramoyl-L-alanine amidase